MDLQGFHGGEPVSATPWGDDHEHHDHDHSEIGAMDLRVRALETVLAAKGYIDPAALDVLIDTYQTRIGPRNGARVVAKAWADPAFRDWLLARRHRGHRLAGLQRPPGRAHGARWRTRRSAHNMVVCTLCSCYPWPVLGLPPTWYKSAPYRSRAVRDPRGVLADFGVVAARRAPRSASGIPPPNCATWSSRSGRPAASGLNEEQLAALVTRDSMIGTGLARSPGAAA